MTMEELKEEVRKSGKEYVTLLIPAKDVYRAGSMWVSGREGSKDRKEVLVKSSIGPLLERARLELYKYCARKGEKVKGEIQAVETYEGSIVLLVEVE